VIRVRHLRKLYRVHERSPGLAAAVRSIFRRNYRTIVAVDRVEFDITPGEIVAFIGPNGAGKTTTLKMLSGLLQPTCGDVIIDGHRPSRREDVYLRKITLVQGHKQQLLWDLPPAETFELNRVVYEVPRGEFTSTMRELSGLLALTGLVNRPTRTLSLGERMKCELAAALLHRPKVLFLDEPTTGLDTATQVALRRFLSTYARDHGATVLLTTHNMDDVMHLCRRAIVIDNGNIVHDGTIVALTARMRPAKRVTLQLSQPIDARELSSFGRIVRHEPEQVVLDVPREIANSAVGALSRLSISDMTIVDSPLEELIGDLLKNTLEV
jgi:ABC-2 type transport system ATP-binding protein